MTAAGILVTVDRRPRATIVLLGGSVDSPKLLDVIELTTAEESTADQAHDLASNLRNRLRGVGADRVLIRRADLPPRPSNKEGPRVRLIMEGALAAAARDVVEEVQLINGRDAAARIGIKKQSLDQRGQGLVAQAEQAAAAAIVGLA